MSEQPSAAQQVDTPSVPPQFFVNSPRQADSTDKNLNEAFKKISLLQELYVEFFGTFIPGFVLLVTTGVLLAKFA